jgi:adenylate cyclase
VSRYSSRAAAIYFVGLTFAILTFVSLQSGRYDGTHYFLFVIGPVLPLLFGAGRWPPHLVAAGLAASTFLVLEFTLPMYIYHNRPWLPQLRNPFVESLDIDADDVIFIVTIFILEGMLTSASYLAMKLAEQAEAALGREFARSESLLRSLLPVPIAERLKDNPDGVIAEEFSSVTVLFADVVGFTSRAASRKPDDVVSFLERVFGELDLLTERHGLEKIKTIGDAYMVAGGMPIAGNDHAAAVADMALDILDAARRLSIELGEDVSVRVGFHTGPAVAGVIGRQKPFYDVWGDTINIAERMQSSGVAGRIQTTADAMQLLHDRYAFEERGVVEVKGKGPMQAFFLTGRARDPDRLASVREGSARSLIDAYRTSAE